MPKVRFTPDEKAKAVMRHLQDGIAISTICSELSKIRGTIVFPAGTG